MHKQKNKLLFKTLVFIAISTAAVMTLFEAVKQLVYADITLWESHLVTILFTTLVSIILTAVGLRKYHSVLKILSGFIPLCAWCKKIRDDGGNWVPLDHYLGKHTSVEFTHGICPECEGRVFKHADPPS